MDYRVILDIQGKKPTPNQTSKIRIKVEEAVLEIMDSQVQYMNTQVVKINNDAI